jgi:hypothetical protein
VHFNGAAAQNGLYEGRRRFCRNEAACQPVTFNEQGRFCATTERRSRSVRGDEPVSTHTVIAEGAAPDGSTIVAPDQGGDLNDQDRWPRRVSGERCRV